VKLSPQNPAHPEVELVFEPSLVTCTRYYY